MTTTGKEESKHPLTKEEIEQRRLVFMPGMIVQVQGMSFQSKGMKGKSLLLRPITANNMAACELKFKAMLKKINYKVPEGKAIEKKA